MQKPQEPTASFQSVPSKVKRCRISALYNTIAELVATNSIDLSDVKVTHSTSSNKPVYYLKFKNLPESIVFGETYKINDCHLTLHKFFKDSKDPRIQNGLAIAHYTEVYLDSSTNKKIVVHIYFNSHRQVEYIQVKEFSGLSEINLDIDAEIKRLLLEHATCVDDLMKKLVTETESLFFKEAKQAKILEDKLEKISEKLSAETLHEYIGTAEKLILAINRSNLYCLWGFDTKAKLIAKIIANLRAGIYSPEESAQIPVEEEFEECSELIDEQELPSNKRRVIDQGIFDDIEKLHKELLAVKNEYHTKPPDIALLIRQSELIKELQFKLLVASSDDNNMAESRKVLLKKVNQNIKEKPDLFKMFISELWLGDFNLVEKLYPYIEKQLGIDVISLDLFVNLINTHPNTILEEQKILKFVDFLYKKSLLFRFVMNDQELMFYPLNNYPIALSRLTYCFVQGNLFMFNLFLQYAPQANCMGGIVGGLQVPLTYLVVALRNNLTYLPYLQSLVNQGASYRYQPKKLNNIKILHSTSDASRGCISKLGLTQLPVTELEMVKLFTSFNNLIEFYCERKSYDAILLFLDQLSFRDQLMLLADLGYQKIVHKRYIFGTQSRALVALADTQQLDDITYLLTAQKGENFSVIIYCKTEIMHNLLPRLIGDNFYERHQKLEEKNPVLLKIIYETLLLTAKRQNQLNNISSAIVNFEACIWLLYLQKDRNFSNYLKIVHVHCLLAACVKKQNTPHHLQAAKNYYMTALGIADKSPFAEQLQDHEIYRHLVEKLSLFKEIDPCLENKALHLGGP